MTTAIEAAVVLVVLLFFSIVSYKKRALDFEGVLAANIIGLVVFLLGGLLDFALITIFFVVSELSTRYARRFLKEKHERRTTTNIIGNSMAAVISLLFASQIAFFGAVAASFADTVASEIGLLSRRKPVLITTFKTVEHGTTGGVTLLGSAAGAAAALIIGIALFYFNHNSAVSAAVLAAGIIGCFADSVFGAALERKGKLNNAQVNFLGSSAGAIAAVALSGLLRF